MSVSWCGQERQRVKAAEEAVYQLVKGAPGSITVIYKKPKSLHGGYCDNTRIPADHDGNDAADQGK